MAPIHGDSLVFYKIIIIIASCHLHHVVVSQNFVARSRGRGRERELARKNLSYRASCNYSKPMPTLPWAPTFSISRAQLCLQFLPTVARSIARSISAKAHGKEAVALLPPLSIGIYFRLTKPPVAATRKWQMPASPRRAPAEIQCLSSSSCSPLSIS